MFLAVRNPFISGSQQLKVSILIHFERAGCPNLFTRTLCCGLNPTARLVPKCLSRATYTRSHTRASFKSFSILKPKQNLTARLCRLCWEPPAEQQTTSGRVRSVEEYCSLTLHWKLNNLFNLISIQIIFLLSYWLKWTVFDTSRSKSEENHIFHRLQWMARELE